MDFPTQCGTSPAGVVSRDFPANPGSPMDATEKKQPNQYLCEFVIELMLNAKNNKGILFKILLLWHNFKHSDDDFSPQLAMSRNPWPRCSTATAPTSRSHPPHWFPWHPIPPPYPVRSGQECCECCIEYEPMNHHEPMLFESFCQAKEKNMFFYMCT